MKGLFPILVLFLVAVAMAVGLTGCSSTVPENASVRPWDAPQDWENGMGGMTDYQHR